MNIIKSLSFTYKHLKGPDKFLVNLFFIVFICGLLAWLIYPAIAGAGIFYLAFAPVGGDLQYIPSAHQELGSGLWWLRRVDDNGAFVTTGEIGYISVTNGGSGFTSAPTVVFSAGDAVATAKIKSGKVVAIEVVSSSGYSSAPTITFTGGDGTGATAVAYLKDRWVKGFGRMKSSVEYGQKKTPVYDEGGKQFSSKKENKIGNLTFTSLQDDAETENFLSKEVGRYKWAIFQACGIDLENSVIGMTQYKYRYIGICDIPNYYKVDAQGREPDMEGIILDNPVAITVNESTLPVANLLRSYDLAKGDMVSTQSDFVEPS